MSTPHRERSDLRLPAYRSSHARRYHPFPRVSRRYDRMIMRGLDDDSEPEDRPLEFPPGIALHPVRSETDDADGDVSSLDLDNASLADDVTQRNDVIRKGPLLRAALLVLITRITLVVERTSRTKRLVKGWLYRSRMELLK